MKFGQLIVSNNRYIFLQKSCIKWRRKTSSRPFLFFLKKLYMINGDYVKWSGAQFQYILMILNLAYNKSKLYKTLDYWSWDMLNFIFSEKGLGIVCPPHFVYDFSTKMFLLICSSNWPIFFVWLPLLLEILGNMCVAFVC